MRILSFRSIAAVAMIVGVWATTMAQTVAFDTTRLDRSADACEDFFQFSNGTWVKNTPIPPAFPRWGSFNSLADSNQDALHEILERAVKEKGAAGSDVQLIGDYYASCMDEAAIDKAGVAVLERYFARIDKVKSFEDIEPLVAWLHSNGVGGLFGFGGGADAKDSNSVIINAGQGGLTLPNKDFYTKTDAKSVETREKFVQYMTNMFKLAGDSPETAAANATAVMSIQMRLANASLSPVELRDPNKRYNKISVTDAQAIIPNFSLTSYMKTRGFPTVETLNFTGPGFFKEVNAMITEVPVASWKTYFRWVVLNSAATAQNGAASGLSKAFADENFDFFSRYLQGTKEPPPRWKQCSQSVNQTLGEALGMQYVKTKFPPEAKARMDQMITNLLASMKSHIEGLVWMSQETKAKALTKLAAYKRKIGYPDKLLGYSGLTIDRKSFFENSVRAGMYQTKRNIGDVGKPTDKTRWGMTPPTVNASYNPINNDITFPAGILQPPFFNFQADDPINYGGIGAVIGHEVSHGFDDQGSQFDADGNLKMWWTPDDRAKFEERANCVVEQFNGYSVLPGVNINGKLTLGENIGDLGGLNIAYTALMTASAGKANAAAIDGFTPEQRFFLGWAQVWAAKATPEFLRNQVLTDPHAWAQYRVNGPLSNMPEFAKAFGCKTGQKMVRVKFCQIW